MADLNEAGVRKVASLARLRLRDDEIGPLVDTLGKVIDYVRQIEQVDTTGVAPLAHPLPQMDVMRDDVPAVGLSTADALANAPQHEGDCFRVPAALDGGGA